MNDNWSQFVARQAWWLSGVAVLAIFDSLMILSSFWPHLFRYDEGMTLLEALLFWNVGWEPILLLSSVLLFLVLKGTSSWRRTRLFALGATGTLVWGLAFHEELRDALFHADGKFPIVVDGAILFGVSLLWSLSLVFVALTSKDADT